MLEINQDQQLLVYHFYQSINFEVLNLGEEFDESGNNVSLLVVDA
jgi:hypothetical protein